MSRQEFLASEGRAGVFHRGGAALVVGPRYEETSYHCPPSGACSPAYYGQSDHNQGPPAGGELSLELH